MVVFQGDCPHCGTRSVAFSIIQEWHAVKAAGYLWDTLAVCGHCSRGVLASFVTPSSEGPTTCLQRYGGDTLETVELSPSLPDSTAPAHTPENVARFFAQGMENLPGNWDAAGLMFRRALEAGLKIKFPDIKGTLYERIEKASKQHKLTPDLAAWSHEIRLGGNDAAHDEEPFKKEDAERLSTFTNLVLLYLFTLPGMLDEARGAADGSAPAEAVV